MTNYAGRTRNVESENAHLLASEQAQGQQGHEQSQLMVFEENQYSEQRAMEAEHIESQLTEISQMMTNLATYVNEQRDTILQIAATTFCRSPGARCAISSSSSSDAQRRKS